MSLAGYMLEDGSQDARPNTRRQRQPDDPKVPQACHVSTSQSNYEIKRMLSSDFNINLPENAIMRPMYYSLQSIIRTVKPKTLKYELYPILVKAWSDGVEFSHSLAEHLINKQMGVMIDHSIESVRASGFQSHDDPMKPLKDGMSRLNEFSHHNKFNKLRKDLIKEKIWKFAVYLSGTDEMNLNGLKEQERLYPGTKRNFGWKTHRGDFNRTYSISDDDNLLTIYLNKNWVIFETGLEFFIGSRDHFIMMVDVLTQRNNGLFLSLSSEIFDMPSYLSCDEFLEILKWGDNILNICGNDGYELITDHEAHCVSVLLDQEKEEITDSTQFVDNLRKSCLEFSEKFEFLNIQDIWTSKMEILHTLMKITPNKVSQAFGMAKLWGNPTVDPILAINKVKSLTKSDRYAPKEFKTQSYAGFVEIFSIRYFQANGVWPNFDTTSLNEDNYLRRILESNAPLSQEHPNYNRLDWTRIKLLKIFEITEDLTITDLISDKTLSADLDEIIDSLSREKGLGQTESRSVILKFLETNFLGVKSFLDDIEKNGFDDTMKLIALRVKELETKKFGRLFGMTTFVVRTYIVVTEALLKKYFLKYIPEITMTDSYLTLTSNITESTFSMSSHSRKIRSRAVMVNMDFEKWNSNMRSSDNNDIFKFFSWAFGYETIFSRTHEMFDDTIFYLSSNLIGYKAKHFMFPKDRINPPMYIGQNGGIEGLRQTGWTCMTFADLKEALRDENVRFRIMGTGDNQVLIFDYPLSMKLEDVRRSHERILKKLDIYVQHTGPPLKLKETWSSSLLFMYGKRIFHRGTELKQSMKSMFKMYEISTEGLPTMESSLSSLTANTMSAVQHDTQAIIPFTLYSYRGIEVIVNSSLFSYLGSDIPDIWLDVKTNMKFCVDQHLDSGSTNEKITYKIGGITRPLIDTFHLQKLLKQRSPSIIRAILLFPPILGGYPIIHFDQLCLKKFPDPLTESIHCIKKYIKITKDEDLKILLTSMLEPHEALDRYYVKLLEDPLSINIAKPPSPSDVVKSTVAKSISEKGDVVNNQYLQLYELSTESKEPLAEVLSTMDPFRPLLMHDIYKASPIGVANQMVQKLSKMITLVRLVINTYDPTIISTVREADFWLFSSILFNMVSRGRIKRGFKEITCSKKHAEFLRNHSWRKQIEGVSTGYPLEYLYPVNHIECSAEENSLGYILVIVNNSGELLDNPHKTVGPIKPNLGSATTEKYDYEQKRFVQALPSQISKAANLMRLIHWVTPANGHLASLIRDLISAYTDANFESLTPFVEKISGEVDHRLASTAIDRGGTITTSSTLLTHHTITTDTLSAYRKSGENFTIVFQSINVVVGSMVSHCLDFYPRNLIGTSLHLHISGDGCCIERINECHSDIDEYQTQHPDLIPDVKDNPFLYVSKDNIQLLQIDEELLYPPLNLNDSDDATQRMNFMATQAAIMPMINKIINEETKDIRESAGSKFNISGKVSIFSNSDPITLFQIITVNLVCNAFLSVSSGQRVFHDLPFLKQNILDYISSTPLSSLAIFNQLYQVDKVRDKLAFYTGGLNNANGSYWSDSDSEKTTAGIISFIAFQIVNNSFSPRLDFLVVTHDSRIFNHPLMVVLILKVLSTETMDFEIMRLIRVLRRCLGNLVRSGHKIIYDLSKITQKFSLLSDIELAPSDLEKILMETRGVKIFLLDCMYDKIMKLFPARESWKADVSLPMSAITDIRSNSRSHKFQIRTYNCPSQKSVVINLASAYIPPPIKNVQNRLKGWMSSLNRIRIQNTGAAFKIYDVIKLIDLPCGESIKMIGEFGGGSGNTTKMLLELFPQAELFFNDLVNPSEVQINMTPHSYPSALIGYPDLQARLHKRRLTYEGKSNFVDKEYPFWLKSHVSERFDLVIVDIEGSFDSLSKELMILVNTIRIMALFNCPVSIMKTYYYNEKYFEIMVDFAIQFCNIEIVRSPFSNHHGTEIYLIIKDVLPSIYSADIKNSILQFTQHKYQTDLCTILDKVKNLKFESKDVLKWRKEIILEIAGTSYQSVTVNLLGSIYPSFLYEILKLQKVFNLKKEGVPDVRCEFEIPRDLCRLIRLMNPPVALAHSLGGLGGFVNLKSKKQADISIQFFVGMALCLEDDETEIFLSDLAQIKCIFYKTLSHQKNVIFVKGSLDIVNFLDTTEPFRILPHLKDSFIKMILSLRYQFREVFGDIISSNISLFDGEYYPKPIAYRQQLTSRLRAELRNRENYKDYLYDLTPIDDSLCQQLFGIGLFKAREIISSL